MLRLASFVAIGTIIMTSARPIDMGQPYLCATSTALAWCLFLHHDVLGAFVLSQTKEWRMANFAACRPFGELDLGDELGLHPGRDSFILHALLEG